MNLKKIEIFGFKSFKNKTVLELRRSITGIAGPNGCGKSNIVDALIWVMGESALKSLRGSSLRDMIFSGSENHPAAPFAEVSLFLERGEAPFPGKYKKLSELMITRRLDREGESACFINRTPCRLKDIKELFLNTGAGCKGFSVIEQEAVEKLVTAKPMDRRRIIEEVAGIAKFRSQKEESLRKLELAEKNIQRLGDLLKEQGERLKALNRQMKNAEKYKALKQEIRDIEMEIFYRSMEEIEALELKAEKTILSLEKSKERERGGREETQSRLRLQKEGLSEVQALFEKEKRYLQTLDMKLLELKKEGEKRESGRRIYNESLKSHRAGKKDLEREIQESQTKLFQLEEGLKVLKFRQKKQKKEMENFKNPAHAWGRFTPLMQRQKEIEGELKEHRKSAEALRLSLARRRAGSEFLKEGLLRAEKAEAVLDRETQKILEKKSDLSKELVSLEKKKRELKKEELLKEKMIQEEERAAASKEAAEERRKNELLAYKIEESEKLIRHFESPNEGTLSLLKWKPQQFRPLIKSLSVDEGFESAFQAALDPYLYALLNKEGKAASVQQAVDYLKRQKAGRASFLLSSKEKEDLKDRERLRKFPAVLCFLDEKAKLPPEAAALQRIARRTAVASNFSSALDLKSQFPDFQFVTLEGDFINREHLACGGSYENKTHVFQIKNNIRDLQEELIQGRKIFQSAEEKRLRADRQGQKISSRLESAQKKESALLKRMEEAALEEEGARRELFLQAEQREELKQNSKDLKERLQKCEKAEKKEEKRCNEAEDVIRAKERISESLSERLDRLKMFQEKKTEAEMSLFALNKEREMTDRQMEACKSFLEKAEGRLADFIRTEAEISANSDRESSRLLEIENERSLVQEELQERQKETERQSRRLQQEMENYEKEEENRKTSDIRMAELEKELSQALLEKEKQKLQKDSLKARLPEGAILEKEVFRLKHSGAESVKELNRRKEKAAANLEALGPVNLIALREYEELLKKNLFLTDQKDDLLRSKKELLKIISHVDRLCGKKFKDRLEEINFRFSRVFPLVFEGESKGEARLILKEAESGDLPGVDIAVRPPGKKFQSVNLLSRGEKALTAICLIYSMFLVQPSPFCVLDEVDAPLDDANNFRFLSVLKQMAEKSKILAITHNKRTMEACGCLYGVTMREPGVSQVVSVDLGKTETLSS